MKPREKVVNTSLGEIATFKGELVAMEAKKVRGNPQTGSAMEDKDRRERSPPGNAMEINKQE